jgi:hypothetical protein
MSLKNLNCPMNFINFILKSIDKDKNQCYNSNVVEQS